MIDVSEKKQVHKKSENRGGRDATVLAAILKIFFFFFELLITPVRSYYKIVI